VDDFIFGTLATDARRLTYEHALRAGVTHRSARNPRDPLPEEPVQIKLTVGPEHFCDRAWVYWSTDGLDPVGDHGAAIRGQTIPMEQVDVIWDNLEWGYRRRFRAMIPGQPAGTVVRYYVTACDTSGNEVQSDGGAYYAYFVANDPTPDWTYDAIVYQIFVDRFYPGDAQDWKIPDTPSGFYGGTLRGIHEKLDDIIELGVNTLWLSPIFPSPSHHGYDATDYFDIEPRLGSKEDLKDLIDTAHARGLRILLDFVPNHWSFLHPNFQSAIKDKNSEQVSWYNFQSWPGQYESFFSVKSLPKINLRNSEAREHILEAVKYWLDFGVDGFRLDYAVGPTRDFWADFRKITREAKPDCWTFGEVVEPPDSQLSFQGLIDGCLDFILLEALRLTFAFRRWDASQFTSFLDRHEAYFPPDFSRPSFLDNHDMNRFLWVVRGDKRLLKLAALCQFTLVGAPVIYYGTEVGLSQLRDTRQDGKGILEESRLPMLWGDDQDGELLEYYKKLIKLRQQERGLRYGARQTVNIHKDILAYERRYDDRSLLILMNLTEGETIIDLDGSWNQMLIATQPCSLEYRSGRCHISLPGYAGVVIGS
jgi:glycosidase